MLANPLGAWTSRNYYAQALPYRLFPAELSLIGRQGLTSDPAFQIMAPGGKLYLLNDNFYSEKDFLWVHGASRAEFILETGEAPAPGITIQNGTQENVVSLVLGARVEEFHLKPGESAMVDTSRYAGEFKRYDGNSYLHGTIQSGSGFVPKLLSRDNPDYRYLGCQVRFSGSHSGTQGAVPVPHQQNEE